MEHKEPIVNLNYIAVLSLQESHLIYKRWEIEDENLELISQLTNMENDPNHSIFDMQKIFTLKYSPYQTIRGGKIKAETYDYCYPNSYRSSYINKVEYPYLYTNDTFQERLDEIKININENIQANIKSGKMSFKNSQIKEEYISHKQEEDFEKFAHKCKYELKKSIERYIYASNYYKTLALVKKEEINKMYSTENIGWTHFNYSVNRDLQFEVRTNFGYGSSSYFYVKMKYKDIDLLPYSDSVRYYYADMIDFVRYTRLYNTKERDSWNLALNFVAEATNLAVDDTNSFIQRWIIDECDQMMIGLRRIYNNPDAVLREMIKYKKNIPDCIYVRNISKFDEQKYAVYKKELPIAFKVEKITGSILLFENLLALKSIYKKVVAYVQEIKDMAINLEEEIKLLQEDIRNDIKKSETDLTCNNTLIEKIKQSYPEEFQEIFTIRKRFLFDSERKKMINNFIESHIYIKEKYQQFETLEIINKIISESIIQRNRFIDKLETGQELIESLNL